MTLPYSEDLESAVIARLLADPSQIPLLVGTLAPEHFYVDLYRQAYLGMQALSTTRRAVDIESLRTKIGKDQADTIARDLSSLTLAHRAPLEEYADELRTYAFRRRVIGTLDVVSSRAEIEPSRDVILSELQDAVQRISDGMDAGALLSPNQAADKYEATLERRASGEVEGLSWGFAGLDHMMTPARGGEMIVLAARPSVGKTVLAEQIASHWGSIAPHPVLFATLEMDSDSLLDRRVSRMSSINGRDIIQGLMPAVETEQVLDAVGRTRSSGVWFLDDPYATTNVVRSSAARLKILSGGISAIVIDYLQLLKDPGDPEVTRVTRISRQIKALALEFRVPVLVLSQLSRASAQREDSHPKLHDLRESGAIEQDADRVLGLWRRDLTTIQADLEILKSRQGATGMVYLDFDGQHFRFGDAGFRDEEAQAKASQEAMVGV